MRESLKRWRMRFWEWVMWQALRRCSKRIIEVALESEVAWERKKWADDEWWLAYLKKLESLGALGDPAKPPPRGSESDDS